MNKIADPNKIYAGQILTIPDKKTAKPAATGKRTPKKNRYTDTPQAGVISVGNPYGFSGMREVPGAIPQEAVLDNTQSIYVPYQKSGGVLERFNKRSKVLKRK